MSSLRLYHYILYFCFLCCILSSCINENMEGCRHFALTVKAVGADGEDINIDSLHSLSVFMFKDNAFVGMLPAGSGGLYQLGYDKDASLTFVAWANLNTDSLNIPKLSVGTKIEDALVQLKQDGGYDLSCSDLFYARKDFLATRSSGAQEDTATLVLKRTVSSLTITTKHLEQYFGKSSSYRYEVHGTKNSFNFLGELTGYDASYSPVSYFDTNSFFLAPAFHVFPSGDNEQISVDIYRGDTRIFTANTDTHGVPLKAVAGKQVNILIDLCSASFTFKVSPWGIFEQNVEF
jgi:hypothetical protein